MAKSVGGQKSSKAKAKKKNIPIGRAYINSTFNNTVITITDTSGNVIAWGSGGTAGFTGSRKSTPFAAQLAAETVASKAMDNGMRELDIYINGPGSGREAAIRALASAGIKVKAMRDITPMPHNGCRARRRPRK
ncbi:MAG: 30S ribosomal protein S11 [Dehalococcoidia bacterium]|jgi:small subunit ribosomal protein S11|nr:MAG: small subunit ribosomal protein S11 [Chloroflexota bacterium]|tara:strand:- start:146 stop:547 length:402 start_codon:yes stop_codon:yes gene_type:complete